MEQLILITLDPDLPRNNKLELILPLVEGVKEWALAENGELTVDYDESEVGPAHIENAVEALGYRVKYAPEEAAE